MDTIVAFARPAVWAVDRGVAESFALEGLQKDRSLSNLERLGQSREALVAADRVVSHQAEEKGIRGETAARCPLPALQAFAGGVDGAVSPSDSGTDRRPA